MRGRFHVGQPEEATGQFHRLSGSQGGRLHLGDDHRNGERPVRICLQDLLGDDLRAGRLLVHQRQVEQAVAVDVRVVDAVAVERGAVGPRAVLHAQGAGQEGERIDAPLAVQGLRVQKAHVRLADKAAVGGEDHGVGQSAGRSHAQLQEDLVARGDGSHLVEAGQLVVEFALELHHLGHLVHQLDVQGHGRVVFPGAQPHQRQVAVDVEERNLLAGERVEAGHHVVEQHQALAGAQLLPQPVPIRGYLGHGGARQPDEDPAVVGHHLRSGQPLGDVVVVEVQPQEVDDGLHLLAQGVELQGLALGRTVYAQHAALERLGCGRVPDAQREEQEESV